MCYLDPTDFGMNFQQTTLAVCGTAAAYVLYKRYIEVSISDIPGPKNPSWIYGHLWWWQREGASVVEKKNLEEHGAIVRWNAFLGEERLWVADPKTIRHILHSGSSLYMKPHATMERLATFIDRGLITVEGDEHKRQRRAMTPAFGLVEARALYPYFTRCAGSLVDKWLEIVSNGESGQAALVNVQAWLSKATLDAIGAGAFDYDFGALKGSDNELTKSYANVIFHAFGRLSKQSLFLLDALKWAPKGLAPWVLDRKKSAEMERLRKNKMYAHEVAMKLIENKRQELKDGTSRKDLLSLLVKANSALRPDWRLNEDEIVAQFRTIMFAGHETTSKTLTLALWELAKNRDVQERLRAEILETLGKLRARSDNDFTVNDFDSMPYLLAVVKETLRVYPVAIEMLRTLQKDDILPLSRPIVGISGRVYNEVPVPAGTTIAISITGYNLNKDVWGSDAYEFRPEQWFEMDGKPESPTGVYGNLATFSGGHRSCIGWRFALIEMHSFLVALIRQFDFSLPENRPEIKLLRPATISPVVVGEEDKGQQMPLIVTVLSI